MTKVKIGVSPAYLLSRYGEWFTPEDVANSLPDIIAMGFSSFQLEVFHPDTLREWIVSGAALVSEAAHRLGIYPSQFTGHFLLHGFSSLQDLKSEFGISELQACIRMLEFFPNCAVITLVIPAFNAPVKEIGPEDYKKIRETFLGKLKTMIMISEDSGKKLALEIMPGSIVGGIQGLLCLIKELGSDHLGYNFDTGHAWACREIIELIPAMLENRIFGTHLKDNNRQENLSLSPGRGTIPWDILVPNLWNSGYRGCWDLEIKCKRDDVQKEYARGLTFMQSKFKSLQGE
jgi:sugar phosphate isomerase/epimerase